MCVLLATSGSSGDLNPFIALGLALKARGAEVSLAAGASPGAVDRAGLHHVPLAPDFGAPAGDASAELHDPDALALALRSISAAAFEEGLAQLQTAGARARVIVAAPHVLPAWTAARLLNRPLVSAVVSPAGLPGAVDVRAGAFDTAYAPARDVERRLGTPPAKLTPHGVFSDTATLGLFSPILGKAEPHHPPGIRIAGAALYDGEGDLDPALSAWLEQGSPPVVFTSGSAGLGAFKDGALAAAGAHGVRALLLGGEAAMADGVLATPYARLSLVLPKALAIVHHGGIGTVQLALAAGTPQLIVPSVADQFDNAARAVAIGAASATSMQHWQAEPAVSLGRFLADVALASRAKALAPALAAEDGAGAAADFIIKTFGV